MIISVGTGNPVSVSLPDVNLVLALVYDGHKRSDLARAWLLEQTDAESVAICRVTQMGLLRLLTQKTVMGGEPLSPSEAWGYALALLTDERFLYVEEPPEIEREWRRISTALPAGAGINTDTYLATFALAGAYTLATFDGGFSRFPDLRAEILRP